ncbi:MAG: 3'(2'),5'-bisphosphate nucleotidase [endosymbiont of Seepiophila jonesi]|uniref:3'(2'),5'-bisphosphate nucleotidase CysQ n=1 Tax=endosymbiont of Lamellibrachia luymesi TaxID=2200907 RepID=A0A370DWK6_9GAMM|nr:MAG: 3'(2'),5'-bisphosphate nucleotidase [endosymbiont of Lamellibrachia luymesi]RDH93639.1 MAG: 3'(2'),5'-bisphosphate nucleotidase [endosymbiont of Seepiophila jonesi]
MYLNEIIPIAIEAGRAIMDVYAKEIDVQTKSDNSPLTEADLASHNIIVESLHKLDPDIPVLSEESDSIPFEVRRSWTRFWLIDPLDGTKEFIKRNGEFTVNIALIENNQPVLGVVYAPALDLLFYGSLETGAFRRNGSGEAYAISASRTRQSPVRVVGSRSHAGESLKHFLNELGPHELISMGSSLKLCLVASGEADIYPRLGPTSEWDTAASQAVVEAAGGRVTDTAGKMLRYGKKESMLNPYFLVFGDSGYPWHEHCGQS